MTLNIKNNDALALVEDLSRATGQNKTQVIIEALREKLAKVRAQKNVSNPDKFMKSILSIVAQCQKMKVKDDRTADEILGYDKNGAFGGY